MEFLTEFLAQVGALKLVWMPFVVGLFVLGFVILKFVRREFATRLANAESTNAMLRELLERSETSDAMAIASASQQLEVPDPAPVQSSPSPSPAAPARAATAAKVYVSEGVTPEHLLGMFEGRTELQAKALVRSELGKWIVAEGDVRGVNSIPSGTVLVALRAGKSGLTFCAFPAATPELERLSEGDTARIEGQIEAVSSSIGLSLENCVFISSHPASPSPPS